MKFLRVLVPLFGIGVLALAIAACQSTPSQAQLEKVEKRVDDVTATIQTVAAATSSVPGIGTIMGGAAAVATGIAALLHALVPKAQKPPPLQEMAKSG